MKNILFLLSCIFLIPQVKAQNSTDRDFLRQVHADTWNCLDAMIDPTTGFPQDTQFPGGHTNTTNIGLYLASLCVAVEKGLTTHQHGFQRAEKILSSLESFERVHGFTPHILDVQLRTKTATGYVAISDFNKLIVGLIMVKQVWPELSERIDDFTQAVEWEKLYHKETGNVSWGYDFDSDRTLGEGHLWLPADTRSAAFLMIATGAAPAEMWAEMDRTPLYTPYGKILRGYGMGGLFMMAMDSLFLPEISSEMGESSGNFAWQQIQFSKQRGYPFWGWSNCYMPGKGYTEGGHLSEQVVTPHALALMIEYYPKHVTQALRGLAKTGGMQGPQGFENVQWGFRDAYDMKSKQWDHRYLSLDQGMLFLALSNYLHDGILRKIYHADPLVQKGLKLIAPYLKPNQEFLKLWAQRDAQVDQPAKPSQFAKQDLHFKPQLNKPYHNHHISTKSSSDQSISVQFKNMNNDEPHRLDFNLPKIDIRGLKSLEIDIDVLHSSSAQTGYLRMLIIDQYQQSRYAHFELKKDQKSYTINEEDLLGLHIDEKAITSIQLIFWKSPWYYQDRKILSDNIDIKVNEFRIIKLDKPKQLATSVNKP